jgi:hypothetical protein
MRKSYKEKGAGLQKLTQVLEDAMDRGLTPSVSNMRITA